MPDKELRALGLALPEIKTEVTTADNKTYATTTDSFVDITIMATTAAHVNLFHNDTGLSSAEGNKIYQKETQGLQND